MSAPGEDDPYACLGITPGASLPEIRRAYKRAVQKRHPDRNPSNPQAHAEFLKVQWAYRTLMDGPLEDPPREPSPHSPAPAPHHPPAAPVGGKEGDATIVVHIPLHEAGVAHERVVSIKVAQPCPACGGSSPSCTSCGGTGQVLALRKWRISIPAGTVDGTWLVGARMGHRGVRFGGAGDVRVQVRWSNTGSWRWEDSRLVVHVRLSARKMKKGGAHAIRMPDGRWVWWTVPPLTSPGQWFRWEQVQWGGMVSAAWIVVERGWSVFSPRGRRPF